MKSNKKNIIVLLVLVMGFVFLPNIKLDFSDGQKSNVINPKQSAGYIESYIHVDGNWSATTSKAWCSGDGSWGNPYTIENVTIDASTSPKGIGIFINNSKNDYFIIRNCTVYNSPGITTGGGIRLEDTNNGTLTNNNCSNNVWKGIVLVNNCNNNTILGNTASSNGDYGILLTTDCDNNVISGNTVNDNSYGMLLDYYSDNNTISGNTANNNTNSGIYLYECDYNTVSGNIANDNDYGIYIEISNDNNISGNTAFLNGHGIFIEELCDYNEITENIINNNTIGLEIDTDCNNTLVFKNFFLANGIHAMDNGTNNKWNSTTIGNYWDNWTSPDTDPLDGIVDDPYTFIGGSTGGTDYLPIAENGAPSITINSPSENDVFGTSAPSFSVTITDTTLDEMWYTLDGGLHNYTFTANGTIDQSAWDALSDSTITLTFYASDIPGNIGSADVIITKGIPSDGLDPTIVIVIVVVSVVGGVAVLAVVYIFMKKRATP